jgi:hypothetical protein
MTAVFISIFLVMGVMIYFIIISLRLVIENATKKVNAYFLSKLSEYDDDFQKKIDEIQNLEFSKEELKQEIRMLQMDHNSLGTSRFYRPRPVERDIFIPTARYIDNVFFEDYKLVKNLLIIDKEEIIRTILDKFPYAGDKKRYNAAKSILQTLNFEAVYDLSSLPEETQLKLLDEELKREEKKLLKEYLEPLLEAKEFNLLGFLNWINEVITKESPILMAYLGEKDEDYSYIADNVICQFDSNVCEGIRIVYQNRLYDYSVYESRRRNEYIY